VLVLLKLTHEPAVILVFEAVKEAKGGPPLNETKLKWGFIFKFRSFTFFNFALQFKLRTAALA
jgi:hypothetical protein